MWKKETNIQGNQLEFHSFDFPHGLQFTFFSAHGEGQRQERNGQSLTQWRTEPIRMFFFGACLKGRQTLHVIVSTIATKSRILLRSSRVYFSFGKFHSNWLAVPQIFCLPLTEHLSEQLFTVNSWASERCQAITEINDMHFAKQNGCVDIQSVWTQRKGIGMRIATKTRASSHGNT